MTKPAHRTVDDYIAAQPQEVREMLQCVRQTIRKTAPDAEEMISYKIPAYKLAGEPVVYFGAWKGFYSIYPATRTLLAAFEKELAAHDVRKSTIRFSFENPVPVRVIGRLVKFRSREAGEKSKRKA
jgi:uncharacterized protein YdhG (YjbR/CyaY superfamily)